jgi:hypothetical protein
VAVRDPALAEVGTLVARPLRDLAADQVRECQVPAAREEAAIRRNLIRAALAAAVVATNWRAEELEVDRVRRSEVEQWGHRLAALLAEMAALLIRAEAVPALQVSKLVVQSRAGAQAGRAEWKVAERAA